MPGFTLLGAAPRFKETQVKAAFLRNFIRFTEWPEPILNTDPFHVDICLQPDDPLLEPLRTILTRQSGQGYNIRLLELGDEPVLSDCEVLYFPDFSQPEALERLAQVRNSPVLTIGNDERFLEQGGIIRFLVLEKRVRFRINQATPKRTGLKISSKLLQLADQVVEITPEPLEGNR